MGICYGKSPSSVEEADPGSEPNPSFTPETLNTGPENPNSTPSSEKWQYSPSPYRFNPFSSPWRSRDSSGKETPGRPRRPFPPPSPAKHITALLLKRFGKVEEDTNNGEDRVLEVVDSGKPLNKNFGYSKNFEVKYELGQEVGRGHFGYTCLATAKKGEMKGRPVAVKVICKAKMTTAISIDDVKREVKILRALTGHANLVRFHDALEDSTNVYIVMEYCEGGELLDRILERGGKYSEEDAKRVIVQILNIVSYCHLQGVVHRDLKPENFLFTTKEETSELKVIDFGLSDYVRPDEKLNDIVGSAYYVAPEVLHRHYSIEADAWSIGVISYILLCGSRPFWARTESGIFRSVLRTAPSFDEAPWPSVSSEAKDFVQRLLSKDRQRRMSVVQALAHPWIRGEHHIPLDIMIFRQVKSYVKASALRQAALKALAKTLTEEDLFYFRVQFHLLGPNKHGRIGLENFKTALSRAATDAMKESKMFELITAMEGFLKSMNFEEFCAASVNVRQLEGREGWEEQLRAAYQIFDENGNRVVMIESIAKELAIPRSVPVNVVLNDWVRTTDGRLSFFGFSNYLRGAPTRTRVSRERQQ